MTSGRSTSGAGLADDLFAVRAKRGVAGDAFEQERLRVLEAGEEGGAEQPGDESDHRGVQQGSSQDAEIERGRRDRAQRGRERRRHGRSACVARRSSHRMLSAGAGGRAHARTRARSCGGYASSAEPRRFARVWRVMPRCCAASVRLPWQISSTRRMWASSISSSVGIAAWPSAPRRRLGRRDGRRAQRRRHQLGRQVADAQQLVVVHQHGAADRRRAARGRCRASGRRRAGPSVSGATSVKRRPNSRARQRQEVRRQRGDVLAAARAAAAGAR